MSQCNGSRWRVLEISVAAVLLFWFGTPQLFGGVGDGFKCTLGGESGEVRAILKQPDGRLLVGGDFTSVKGVPRYAVARLNPDGSVDPGFDAGIVLGSVRALALQPDGKLIIGGDFRSINGTPRYGFARLNADGTVDGGFNPAAAVMGSSNPGQVYAVAVQPDGRIVIGGAFANVDGAPRAGVARLNPDGSLDVTFDPGSGAGATVTVSGGSCIGPPNTDLTVVTSASSADATFNAFDPNDTWVVCQP